MGVHGDKAVVGGKTSTLKSFSTPTNKKKNINADTSANLRLLTKKSSRSISPTAAGSGKRSNASTSVDANMAPALTEPMSPTEKSNAGSTTATIVESPNPASNSTESEERKLELTPVSAASSSSPAASSLRNSPANREKRSNTRIVTNASTRVTRSKDSGATATTTVAESGAVAEVCANTPIIARDSPTVPSIRKSKRYSKEHDNEQMGLNVATPPPCAPTATPPPPSAVCPLSAEAQVTEVSAIPTSSKNNNNNDVCKDNSTAQLLADLTTDFEETITAEICLRKQLPEVKVTTPDAAQLSASSETESETTGSKSAGGGETPEIAISTAKRMEISTVENAGDKSNTFQQAAQDETIKNVDKGSNIFFAVDSANEAPSLLAGRTNAPATVATPTATLNMPPANSDSTMTASEEEPEELDALEAKLSQLDGNAVESPLLKSAEVAAVANTALSPDPLVASFSLTTTNITSTQLAPNSPLQTQVLTPSPLMQQAAMPALTTPTQQLLPTSTGNASGSGVGSHMTTLTPQITSSLIRDVNATAPGNAVGGIVSGSGGGELEDQELEEVLKALKGFDANAAGAEGMLCDLNVLLNEVYTTFNCDEMAAAATTTNTGALQQQLPQSQTNLFTLTTSTSPLKELHADIEKKQQIMQRKIDFILRRLRKLQVRYMAKHTAEEIAGLFELIARLTHKGANNSGVCSVGGENSAFKDLSATTIISARPPARCWEQDLNTAISSTEMLNLLERLEKSATTQQICTAANTATLNSSPLYAIPTTLTTTQQMRKSKKLNEAANATTNSSTATTANYCAAKDDPTAHSDDCVVAVLNPQVVDELTHISGMLRAEMRDMQVAYDSDATDSSSGGESADEMVAYNNQVQQTLSIVKRAAWRYSRERAAIASRWSWLLSQIADLEIKIRQHSELYQEVVRTKGAVVCEEELSADGSATSTTRGAPSSLSTTSPTIARTQALINAYGEHEDVTPVLMGSCRTRGFIPTQFRKRKMLQTTSLHTISKKAARPSTIKCGCQCPLNPCALCTGRTDPTAPRDLPDTMMFSERVALLDPGFHPVLSFSADVSNSIHFESIAKTPQWQNRIVRIQPKSVVRSVWKAEREAANSSSHHSSRKYGGGGEILLPTQKRRYIRRKERNTSTQNCVNQPSSLQQPQDKNVGGVSGNFGYDGNSGIGSTDFTLPDGIAAIAAISTPQNTKQATMSKFETATPTITLDSTASGTVRNGTANIFTSTMSTTTTTPLVANMMSNDMSPKKMNSLLVGNNVLLEPLTPDSNNKNNSTHANSCQTPQQNFDLYNPSPIPSSLISNSQQQQQQQLTLKNSKKKHYKHRKTLQKQLSSNNIKKNTNNSNNINNNSYTNQQQHSYHHHNNSQINNSNSDVNLDYWDTTGVGGRSRTASPTYGGFIGTGSSNYHKYERSLERRNRISYDIDNIVIPYSVAAATRVEILPYKEIPTPKWRVFDDELAFDQELEENKFEMPPPPVGEAAILREKIEPEKEEQGRKQESKATTLSARDNEENDDKMFAKPTVAALKPDNEEAPLLLSHARQQQQSTIQFNSLKAEISDKRNESFIQENEKLFENEQPAKKVKFDDKDRSTNSLSNIEVATDTAKKIQGNLSEYSEELISACDLDEDITDDAFNVRHERALHEERRKFQTYLKFPWSTRSRANRRIDSRAESSGANTPDPASPAPNTPSFGGGDQESIPSPLAPSTPLTPLDAANETPESGSLNTMATSTAHSSAPAFPLNIASILSNYGNSGSNKRNERRRTISTKTQSSAERNERRSLTPDTREVPFHVIPPFEPLKFPLSDEAYETLASLTFLPPTIKSYCADNNDFLRPHCEDDGLGGGGGVSVIGNVGLGHVKATTPRNGRRTISVSKLGNVTNGAVNGGPKKRPYRRNQSILDVAHKVADDTANELSIILSTTKTDVNGQMKTDTNSNAIPTTAQSTDLDDDENDDEFDFYDALAEADEDDDDDGYPKHSLAPNSNIDNLIDDDYDAYDVNGVVGINGGHMSGGTGEHSSRSQRAGHNSNHLGFSDSEFSEPDPFEDDDPNDPEWRGETTAKAERQSERLKKRSLF